MRQLVDRAPLENGRQQHRQKAYAGEGSSQDQQDAVRALHGFQLARAFRNHHLLYGLQPAGQSFRTLRGGVTSFLPVLLHRELGDVELLLKLQVSSEDLLRVGVRFGACCRRAVRCGFFRKSCALRCKTEGEQREKSVRAQKLPGVPVRASRESIANTPISSAHL